MALISITTYIPVFLINGGFIPFNRTEKRDVFIKSLQDNGPDLPLIGREKQIERFSEILWFDTPKTTVGLLVANRGIGKTAMLKALVDPERYNVKIDIPKLNNVRAVGRLAVVDLTNYQNVLSARDFDQLWIEIILDHLWKLFQNCVIDGIEFTSRDSISRALNFPDSAAAFRKWKNLTNSAYGVNSNVQPVILLDEINVFMNKTTLICPRNKLPFTQLSLAIRCISNRAFIIAAGTTDCDLVALANYNIFVPMEIIVTPYSMNDVYQYGRQYCESLNLSQWPKTFNEFLKNRPLIQLFYQTLQVPRLVNLALEALVKSWESGSVSTALTDFQDSALSYYNDAVQVFDNFTNDELVHILFVCATGFRLKPNDVIPKTSLKLADLVNQGVVFHYAHDRYTTLLWMWMVSRAKLHEINDYAKQLIPSIDLNSYFSLIGRLDQSLDLREAGVGFEKVFAELLRIKYYLHSIVKNSTGPFNITEFYELSRKSPSYATAAGWVVNLEKGYVLHDREISIEQSSEYPSKARKTTVADLVAPGPPDIHIECKYSMDSKVDTTKIVSHLKRCDYMIWVHTGIAEDEYSPSFENEYVKRSLGEREASICQR